MSFDSKPATTVNDPYANMPKWVKDYYQSEIKRVGSSNERADALRQAYSNPDALVPGYRGGEHVQYGLDMADAAIKQGAGTVDRATAEAYGAAGIGRDALEGARQGMAGSDARLAGLDTNLGKAFNTGTARGQINQAATKTGQIDTNLGKAFNTAPARGRIEGDAAASRNVNTDLGRAFDTTGAQGALTGMDIAGLQSRYEDQFLQGRLDPVLERMMEEEAMRRAQAEGSAAAIGGSNNTRMAVEMARIGSEGARDRAQLEAEMRRQSQLDAASLGMQEGELRGNLTQMAAQLGLSESELESRIREQSSRLALDALSQGASLDQVSAQLGLSQSELQAMIKERQANLQMGQQGQMAELAHLGARLGLDESQINADIKDRAARLGISVEEARQQVYNDMGRMAIEQFGMTDAAIGRDLQGADLSVLLGQLGLTAGGMGAAAAEDERRIDQERMQAPLTMEQWARELSGMGFSSPLPNSGTQTQQGGGPGIGTQLLGAGATVLGAWLGASDERVKDDVTPLSGEDALNVIRMQRPSAYRYTDPAYDRVPVEGRRSAGLMAQDLTGIEGAVIEGDDGVLRVDAYPVLATIAAAVQELDRRMEARHGT